MEKNYECQRCKWAFDVPLEITAEAREYYGSKSWTYTAECCPQCESQNIKASKARDYEEADAAEQRLAQSALSYKRW